MVEIRHRVLLEPRGFIRLIEFVLAIVTFATTGGYVGSGNGTLKCSDKGNVMTFNVTITYPFNLQAKPIPAYTCNATTSMPILTEVTLQGDFSPTSQWFVFVGVMAFLICLASIVFYVAFELEIRQAREYMVTMTDLVVTVLWAFLWLTAAASWAWGVNQVKIYSEPSAVCHLSPVKEATAKEGVTCANQQRIDYGSLNASVAFAFLSFIVWVGNVWFVYKETPYHEDAAPPPSNLPNQ